jgi:hypothetical protein
VEAQRWYSLGQMNEDVQMIAICQEMGWDYYIYKKQPSWFLDLILMKLNEDSKRIKREEERLKNHAY